LKTCVKRILNEQFPVRKSRENFLKKAEKSSRSVLRGVMANFFLTANTFTMNGVKGDGIIAAAEYRLGS
jgi:hypothetical protein